MTTIFIALFFLASCSTASIPANSYSPKLQYLFPFSKISPSLFTAIPFEDLGGIRSNTPDSIPTQTTPQNDLEIDLNFFDDETSSSDDDDELSKLLKVPLPGESVRKLKTILAPGITRGFVKLTGPQAKELLTLKGYMETVLDPKKRADYLNANLNNQYKSNMVVPFHDLDAFKDKMTEETTTLKDFLKILLQFYNNCLDLTIRNECLLVIIRTNIFDHSELAELLKRPPEWLFIFACKFGAKDFALELIKHFLKVIDNRYICSGLVYAFEQGNYDFVNELLAVIGKFHGTEPGGVYHSVLSALAKDFVITDENANIK